jgi:hypothetical protein
MMNQQLFPFRVEMWFGNIQKFLIANHPIGQMNANG